jgi:TolB-like protein
VAAISGLLTLAAVLLVPRLVPSTPPVVALFAHDARGVETAAAVSAPLGAALTTALTASLRDVAGIVGPTGTAAISGPDDTEGARSSLGACLVVSGAVQATGTDSVIVFTQIVRTTDRVHVWARLDTVSVSNAVAAIVPGVARGVVAALPGC